jgi:integrase/recombinase XerC
MKCAEAVRRYFDYLRRERNVSPHTLRNYEGDLRQFSDFLNTQPDGAPEIEAIDHLQIRSYLGEFYARRGQNSSAARRLSVLRSLFKFLAQEGVVRNNPARLVTSPKVPRKLPEVPTAGELEKFFAKLMSAPATGRDEILPVRDRAIFELLYGCGLRAAELVGLNRTDIEPGVLRVRGKGSMERIVPYGRHAALALTTYLQRHPAGPVVFVNHRGGRLTTRSVGRIVKKYALLFAENTGMHPHSFRHAYATHMLDSGADLRAIQELLGHARLSTTQKYTQVSIQKLLDVYGKSHPKA